MPNNPGNPINRCELCGRKRPLTFHHLIPRKMHRRTRFQNEHTRMELARGIEICRICHDGIHDLYDEMTLARRLNSREALLRDDQLRQHVQWAARQRTG